MKKRYFITTILFLIITFSVKSQCKYYNKVNSEGNKTGLWLSYWDKQKKVPSRVFHYKNGRESGICKMYSDDGKLMMKERHLKNRIKEKRYNEQGKIRQKGYGVIEFKTEVVRFYWEGRWKFYGEKHRLNGISIYENGVFIESKENKRVKRNQMNP